MPSCPKCPGTSFMAWDYPIAGVGTVKLVCCSQCGAVVGVVNAQVDSDLSRLKQAIRDIAQRLGVVVPL